MLASLSFCIVTKPGQSHVQQLGAIGTLFAVWAVPSAFVHLLGQHLERRFSHFDRRVGDVVPLAENKPEPPTGASDVAIGVARFPLFEHFQTFRQFDRPYMLLPTDFL